MHVNVDPSGALGLSQLEQAIAALRHAGFEVMATDLEKLPAAARELEVIHPGDDPDVLRELVETACARALAPYAPALPPRAFAVSFISSGSREDALGIVHAFGLGAELRELTLEGDDRAVLVFERAAPEHAIAAKLQTVLEAALNREVRFVAPA